ncbi:hypothetical protein [Anaerotignum sp. MB30-C6]|uniref:hypothetical protein n=1 Tax=Anaerotignum sp. MB30-C6 TaxID=3070814 RepID=UPI0027DCF93E|nr:hypothetical protein [Anaerotignum sp. MB30-C6]WMI80681.1 hypothetical protein RBQ60_12745 [Anaerotignum sp. MB30-C6]
MKKRISMKKKILHCIFFCVLLYFAGSVYISLKIESLIVAANEVPLRINPSPEIISDENFRRLGYKNMHSIRGGDSPNAREFSLRTPVFTLYWPKNAKSIYIYSYEARDGEWSTGSWRIPVWVTSEFKDGAWVITDVYEHP